MTFAGRLLGLNGNRADTTPTVPRPPQAATLPIGWSNGKNPQTAEWDAATATDVGYYGYIYHYGCARTLATTISGLPWRMGPNPNQPGVYNVNNPLARLLGPPPGGPAPGITPRQLLTHSIVSYLITGRWAWETPTPVGPVNQPGALWPLTVAKLKPIPTEGGLTFFSGYEYQRAAGTQSLRLDQVFYAWRPSQKDWREPESAMMAMALPTRMAIALNQYMTSFMDNNMVGSKLVVTPGYDDNDMRRSFQDQFLSEMTGSTNAGRTAFAEFDDDGDPAAKPSIQVIDMGTKPVDAQIIELLNWCRDTICDGWHVPVSILGQAASRTYANADQEHRNYWTGAVLDLIAELQDLINVNLAPRFGDDVGWFDLSGVEALKPSQRFTPMPGNVAIASGAATVGEVREDMALPPLLPVAGAPRPDDPIPAIDDTPGTAGGSTTGSNPAAARSALDLEPGCVMGHRAGGCTGPGPCDETPIGEGKNWVTSVGGLPAYIRAVAHALIRSGHTESEAIQLAVGTIQRWARGEGNVTAPTRARAAAALAEWEAKKAAAHASRGALLESSSAGALAPTVGKPILVAHIPVPGAKRGQCAVCDKPTSDPIHMRAMGRSKRGKRHAGPIGHAHVPSGHHTTARRRVVRQVDEHAVAMEPALSKTMQTVFSQQRKATVDRLNGNRGKQMLRAAQPSDSEQPAPVMDASQVFDYSYWVQKTQDALDPFYAAVAATPQPRLAKFAGTDTSRQAVAAALKARSAALAQSVSSTTLEQIQQVLNQAVVNGDSIAQMTAAIQHVFDVADTSRAQMIARTESLGAINAVADTHAAALGPDVVAGKEWAAAHDTRVRPTHRVADGQVRAITEPYVVGSSLMSGPGDPTAPPDEVINCRCCSLYLTPSEYAQRSGMEQPATPIAA